MLSSELRWIGAWKIIPLALLVTLAACDRSEKVPNPRGSEQPADPSAGQEAADPGKPGLPNVRVSTAPPPAEIWKEFSGDRAFAEVRRQIEIGPRPSGSPGAEKAREVISQALERNGWEVTRQEFTGETPRGPIKFVNVIGRFAADGSRPVPIDTQRAIVCSHFDTKRFSTIQFVGANDAGSSTGSLIELSRVLALDPKLAAQVELVFFDGEEALVQFTAEDGIYGSRHYASQLREQDRAKQFKFGILWDMIGDRDLSITLPPDSPAEVAKGILKAADALNLRSHFRYFDRSVIDDHVPLNQAGIPTIDLIDFDYLYWHTADDTMDKLAPESMQKVGAVTLYYLRKELAGK